jgi:RecA-family ATPase
MYDRAQKPNVLQPNVADIRTHLFALFPPAFVHHYPDAQIEIVYGPPGRFDQSRWYSAFDIKTVVNFVEVRSASGDNIYVGAALRHGSIPETGRAKTENFLAAQHARCEYDKAGDHERVVAICKNKGLEPAIIVVTGTVPHMRVHLYFKITDGITDAAMLKEVNTALRGLFDSDEVTDAIRVMRLAGCINTPDKDKRERGYVTELVTVQIARDPRGYSIEELVALRPAAGTAQHNSQVHDLNDAGRQSGRTDEELFTLLETTRIEHKWHNSMLAATGSMIGRGWNDDAIRTVCGPYCDKGRNDPDLTELIDGGRKKWDKPSIDIQAATEIDIEFLDMSTWDNCKPPPREWAVQNRIPLRQPSLLAGEGGVGKTILLLQLLCSTALENGHWIGMVPEPGHTIYLGAEDEADELWRRLYDIAEYYDVKFADMRERLHVASYAGKDATLARFDRLGRMEPTPLYHRLHKGACDIRPKIIGLDTVSDIFAGNENDRTQVSAFLGLLRNLAMASNSAVIINTHPSLTGINTGTGTSGSTGWHNRVRSRMYFKPAEIEKGEEIDPDLRVLEFRKNQYGPLGHSILLRWRNGVFIPEPSAGSLEKQAAERRVDDLFLKLLERFICERRNVNHKPGPSYAPKLFAEEPEAKQAKCGKAVLEDAMRRLLLAQKIHLEPYGPKSKQADGQCRFAMGAAP